MSTVTLYRLEQRIGGRAVTVVGTHTEIMQAAAVADALGIRRARPGYVCTTSPERAEQIRAEYRAAEKAGA